MPWIPLLLLGIGLGFPIPIAIGREISAAAAMKSSESGCPLNFDSFRKLIIKSYQPFPALDAATECQYAVQGISMLRSEYLRSTGHFSLPQNVSELCWRLYSDLVNEFMPDFRIESSCGFDSGLLSEDCREIENRSEFERLFSRTELEEIGILCDQSLKDDSRCGQCSGHLVGVRNSHFLGSDRKNSSICDEYPFIYAAAFANRFGPIDVWTAKCLFLVNFVPIKPRTKRSRAVLLGILTGCFHGVIGGVIGVWCLWLRHKNRKKRRNTEASVQTETPSFSGMIGCGEGKAFVRFSLAEVKEATGNFSRHNVIGMGGYGNVYKGVLFDGSEVAFKRFKNCSAAWDQTFAHEIEVIASVKHVNLLALRGYCTVTGPLEGHQRIIICELMKNGSLYDHLFASDPKNLSWPIRKRIALGVARGLAYLHYGVQPAVIHRDIKASNILVDETLEPKLADFGLAKFTQEGLSHLSTKVAGTLGYVAPEYALYGQLSERSDVYSFGVVLLELLSGKKAVISVDSSQTLLLTDWSWCLVREGRALSVVDEGVPDLGPQSEMERHVLIAVLCSHPVAYARPTMDHVVKMLESDFPVPPIPDHPFPIFAQFNANDASRSFGGLTYTPSLTDDRSVSD